MRGRNRLCGIRWVCLAGVLIVVLLACVIFPMRRDSFEGDTEFEVLAAQWSDSEEYDIVSQWTDCARELGYGERVIERINTTIEQTLPAEVYHKLRQARIDLQPSLRRFLLQFKESFHRAPRSFEPVGVDYWFCWLLVRAVERGGGSEAEMEVVRGKVEDDMDELCEHLERREKGFLASRYDELEGHVGRRLSLLKTSVVRRYEILQKDPLFPAFETPRSQEAADEAIRRALSGFRQHRKMGHFEEERYLKSLEMEIRGIRPIILYHYSEPQIRPAIRNFPYWREKMLCSSTSGDPDSLWPILVTHEPKSLFTSK